MVKQWWQMTPEEEERLRQEAAIDRAQKRAKRAAKKEAKRSKKSR